MNRAELVEALKWKLAEARQEITALEHLIALWTPKRNELVGVQDDLNAPTRWSEAPQVHPEQPIIDEPPVPTTITTSPGVDEDGVPVMLYGTPGMSLERQANEAMDVALEPIAKRGRYDWDAVKEMYDQGVTFKAISEKTGIPKSTIQTHASRAGWKKRYRKYKARQKPAPGKRGVDKGQAFWGNVRYDWETSLDSIKQIARDMQVSESTIHYHAKRDGWGLRPKDALIECGKCNTVVWEESARIWNVRINKEVDAAIRVKCPSCELTTHPYHSEGKSDYTCEHCHVLLPTGLRK